MFYFVNHLSHVSTLQFNELNELGRFPFLMILGITPSPKIEILFTDANALIPLVQNAKIV